MEANKNISEYFTLNSFKSLGGSSAAVWLSCAVINTVFNFNPKWLALVLSVLISVIVCVSQKKKKVQHYFIALLNGMLIFSTATGFNTFNNADWSDKSKIQDTTKKSGMIQNTVYQSSLFPFDKPWFLPKTLVEENEMLVKEKGRLLKERDSVVNINKKLTEETALLPKNEKEFKNKLDSLNNLFNNAVKESNDLKNEIERLKNSLKKAAGENEDCKNKLAKLQADYKALQTKYDKLAKDSAGYDKLKSSYEQLKSEYEKLKKECDAIKSRYGTLQGQLQECNKKLSDCVRKIQ